MLRDGLEHKPGRNSALADKFGASNSPSPGCAQQGQHAGGGSGGLPIRHGQDLVMNSSLLGSLEDVFLRSPQPAIQYVVIYCVIEQRQILQPNRTCEATANPCTELRGRLQPPCERLSKGDHYPVLSVMYPLLCVCACGLSLALCT